MDPYAKLGLERGASLEEVKRAYRRLAKETHPDLGASPDQVHRFHEIQSAYRELRRRIPEPPREPPPRREPAPRSAAPRRPEPPPPSNPPWIEVKREEAALALGRNLPDALEIRPQRGTALLGQTFVCSLAFATLSVPESSWLSLPQERHPLLLTLALVLLVFIARNAWFHFRRSERICLSSLGLYIVSGRNVTSVPLTEIRQIDFGYDPITRFGFRPYSLRIHVEADRPPIRIPSSYGERELRTLAGWTYDRSRGLHAV